MGGLWKIIDQLDGNTSLPMNMNQSVSVSVSPTTPSPTSTRPDKIFTAGHLRTVASYNFRSLFPKIGNAKNDILEREISVAFCSEIWEKSEKRNHKFKIENMLQSEGLQYISTPRPMGRVASSVKPPFLQH